MLNESGANTAEIQRNEFANTIGCAPSQINYVLSSRFTPEHGYMIESRRGGGGYIRIRRVVMSHTSALMHIINSIGGAVDPMTTRIILENCIESGIISADAAKLIATAHSCWRSGWKAGGICCCFAGGAGRIPRYAQSSAFKTAPAHTNKITRSDFYAM